MRAVVGFLIVAGLVVAYWQWILALIVVVLVVKAAPAAYREFMADRAEQQAHAAALVARADQQHRWAMSGDARGVYGAFPPAV